MSTTSSELMVWAPHGPGHRIFLGPIIGRGTAQVVSEQGDELANIVTHGAGLVLSLAGAYALVSIAAKTGDLGHVLGCGVYGASLVLLYAASTCYHVWPPDGTKRVLLLLDHIGIYVLIAGTYAPVAMIPLRGPLGWSMLIAAYGMALTGSVAKAVRINRLDNDSSLPYLAMGWMSVALFGQLVVTAPWEGNLWLVAGGGFYTAGLAFFFRDHHRFNHAIWHVFVLAGSICHYRAVVIYLSAAAS
jgi:hemolysin III